MTPTKQDGASPRTGGGPCWLYLQSERGEYPLWTVGFYEPVGGRWIAESDHQEAEEAADRVHFLNGGLACLTNR